MEMILSRGDRRSRYEATITQDRDVECIEGGTSAISRPRLAKRVAWKRADDFNLL